MSSNRSRTSGSRAITVRNGWCPRWRQTTPHTFFIDAVLRRRLIELGTLGVTRVLARAEKSAAYMADGCARIAGRPGVYFVQSVDAANLPDES